MLDSRKQLNTMQVVQHWDRTPEVGISGFGRVQAPDNLSCGQLYLALATALLGMGG